MLYRLSATELLRHLEGGETTSVAIVEALIARANETEPRVNALTHRFDTEALAEAKRCDEERAAGKLRGPLHGLPITIKESVETAGLASTMGLESRRGEVATRDAVSVAEARRLGAIPWAKTNVPQTLMVPMESVNFLFGATHNAFKHGHGSGGSSGGEGVAIAVGSSVLGFATDIGGSIRVPAAFNGVCGLKPTVHRWSNLGSHTAIKGQEVVRGQIGPMARTVADLDLVMRAMDPSAMALVDPYVPPLPYPRMDSVDLASLKVGYYEDDGFLTPAASVRRGVREAVAALGEAGVELVPFTPPNVEDVLWTYIAAMAADGNKALKRIIASDPVIDPLKTIWKLAKLPAWARKALGKAFELSGEGRVGKLIQASLGGSVDAQFALAARRAWLRAEELRAWQDAGIAALVCPNFATSAAPFGMSHDFTLGFACASRYNFLDLPAGSLPVTSVQAEETQRPAPRDRIEKRAAAIEAESVGLPIGVQVVGLPYQEHVVLKVMAAIESIVRHREGWPRTPVDPG